MTEYTSDFLNVLSERGFIAQVTDGAALNASCVSGTVTAYIGYDCTGPSLHVGHLVQILMLRWLQKTGHKPIVLMGGGTTKVGDPSGKDESRKILTDEVVEENMAGIRQVFSKFLTFGDGPMDAVIINNADWLDTLEYIPFLRDYGPHFAINRMLTFDSVKLRLDREHTLSFMEFNYMILQAYDFLELSRRHGCILQMGGSDQWGNIVNGIELIRRVDGTQVFGLTTPLLTTSTGAKMGKTADGAVWLNADMLSDFDYWQFWRNTADADVVRFLKLFTDLELSEIDRIGQLQGQDLNEGKILLANEATAMARSPEAAAAAAETARQVFVDGAAGGDLPVVHVSLAALADGIPVVDLFVEAGLAASKGKARRLIKGRGAKVNNEAVPADDMKIGPENLQDGQVKLSAGKKRHALVQPEA